MEGERERESRTGDDGGGCGGGGEESDGEGQKDGFPADRIGASSLLGVA